MNELFNLSACCAFNPFFKHTTYQCDIKETIVTAITSNIHTIFKRRLPCCIVCNTQGSEITKYANKAKQTFILRGQNVVYNVPTLNWIIFKYIIFDGPETNFFMFFKLKWDFGCILKSCSVITELYTRAKRKVTSLFILTQLKASWRYWGNSYFVSQFFKILSVVLLIHIYNKTKVPFSEMHLQRSMLISLTPPLPPTISSCTPFSFSLSSSLPTVNSTNFH